MDSSTVGLIGAAICGVVLVGLGVGAGIYLSLESTKGPQERAYVKRCAIITLIVVTCYCGLMFIVPGQYKGFLAIPYVVWLLVYIYKVRKKHTQIRRAESGDETFISHL